MKKSKVSVIEERIFSQAIAEHLATWGTWAEIPAIIRGALESRAFRYQMIHLLPEEGR